MLEKPRGVAPSSLYRCAEQAHNLLKNLYFLLKRSALATSPHVVGTLAEIVDVALRRAGVALMGVVNTTPDSFFDGGQYDTTAAQRERLDQLVLERVDIIDVGAESTRPGAQPVGADEQWERSQFAVSYACSRGAIVSIDTTSPEVADKALKSGARIINDVSCLQNAELARVAARRDADLVIMHSLGSMQHMPGFSIYSEDAYRDIIEDISQRWLAARRRALQMGLAAERIWFDPGFGFHKTLEHNTELLQRLSEFQTMTPRIVVGTSRKSFIGALDESPPEHRLGGTIATCLLAFDAGAQVLRVHDVQPVRQALLAWRAFRRGMPAREQAAPPGSSPGLSNRPGGPAHA